MPRVEIYLDSLIEKISYAKMIITVKETLKDKD